MTSNLRNLFKHFRKINRPARECVMCGRRRQDGDTWHSICDYCIANPEAAAEKYRAKREQGRPTR